MSTIEAVRSSRSCRTQPLCTYSIQRRRQATQREELRKIETYWKTCNYLSLGMIYLQENPLLKEPLRPEHIKNRLLGHWGTSPGLSFIYVHLNRLIKKYDLDMIFLAGPGHGAPGVLGPTYLEGTYSEIYPEKSQDPEGLREFFRQFSFPGRHRQSLHAGNSRIDSRRRRTRLRAFACVRRGFRQSRTDRRGRGRRRRIGNWATGYVMAHQQIPQSGARRSGSADPSSERLQDRQSDDSGAHLARGTGEPVARVRLDAVFRGRLRHRQHAPGDGGDRGALRAGDPRTSQQAARKTAASRNVRAGR